MNKYGSDLIMELIHNTGINYIINNPGATFRGAHDSLVNSKYEFSFIECLHEEISVAIAHGYAKATGKPAATFVHNIVGLQHASMAIFNAWCDRVPILVCGATGPLDNTQKRPWIDWIHTANDQGAIVKDYVKWVDQPASIASLQDSIYRGFNIMNMEPKAPVYICFDAEVQEAKTIEEAMPFDDYALPTPPSPSDMQVKEVLEELLNAKSPAIMVDYMGRNADSVDELVKFIEHMSIPVIDCGGRYNFPNTHSMAITGCDKDLYEMFDLILALDVNDIYGAIGSVSKQTRSYKKHISNDIKIIHVSLNHFLISSWAQDYHQLCPIAKTISADSYEFLKAINSLIARTPNYFDDNVKKTIIERKDFFSKLHADLRNQWNNYADSKMEESPLAISSVLRASWQALKEEKVILVNNANTPIGAWTRKLWDLDRSGCYLGGSGGVGLGYGIAASIGGALAYKDNDEYLCVNIQTDGDLLYCPNALWTAAHHNIPLLVLLMNNRTYYNSEEHAIEIAKYRGRDISNAGIGTHIRNPDVDFEKLCDGFGVKCFGNIQSIEDLENKIEEAVVIIKEQKTLVMLDIRIQNR